MKRHASAWFLAICHLLWGCDESPAVAPRPGDELELSEGSIGLVVDTRELARAGYEPVAVTITFLGDLSAFSQTVNVHGPTSVATLQIEVDALDEAQRQLFAQGVEATILVADAADEELARVTDTVSVDSSNTPLRILSELRPVYPEPAIREGVPYYVQALAPDSPSNGLLMRLHIDREFEPAVDPFVLDILRDSGVAPEDYEVYFEPDGNGDYYLKYFDARDEVMYYLEMSTPGFLYNFYRTEPPTGSHGVFRVERTEDGNLRIQPNNGSALVDYDVSEDANQPYTLLTFGEEGEALELRIVAANIEWTVQDRGTEYSAPVLPPARLDFAFRSVLRNCSEATLTETVGQTESRTRETTMGTEESLELYSGSTTEIGVTAGVETQASFFGQSVTASLEVSTNHSWETSSTMTSTNTWSATTSTTVEVSRERQVEIPPFTAVEVYDAIQTLEQVQLPFVQVLRIGGAIASEAPLSGAEVADQLLANQFGGVVTAIEDEFVEVTVRGVVEVENFFEVESTVDEIVGGCD